MSCEEHVQNPGLFRIKTRCGLGGEGTQLIHRILAHFFQFIVHQCSVLIQCDSALLVCGCFV